MSIKVYLYRMEREWKDKITKCLIFLFHYAISKAVNIMRNPACFAGGIVNFYYFRLNITCKNGKRCSLYSVLGSLFRIRMLKI